MATDSDSTGDAATAIGKMMQVLEIIMLLPRGQAALVLDYLVKVNDKRTDG